MSQQESQPSGESRSALIRLNRKPSLAPWNAALGFALFAFIASTSAQAGDDDKAQAKAHYQTATRYYEVQEYDKALGEYKAAYVAKPDPAFLFNIGQCYRKLENNEKALESFKQFLKKAEPKDPNRALVEARIRDIESELSAKNSIREEPKTTPQEIPAPTNPQTEFPNPPTSEPVMTPVPLPPSPMMTSGGNSYDPVPPIQNLLVQESPPPAPMPKPAYKTWWFWAGMSAIVGGGVVAIVLSSRHGTTIPPTTLGSQEAFK
jgi:tetratricopeptide (TPR) repeat protein